MFLKDFLTCVQILQYMKMLSLSYTSHDYFYSQLCLHIVLVVDTLLVLQTWAMLVSPHIFINGSSIYKDMRKVKQTIKILNYSYQWRLLC